ncbi:MAG: hypothetical protein IKK93_00365 [Campylobacter sp.]|nr:hypothetical protein [Campylobacter sp.]
METLNEEHITPYWRQLFQKICPQSSIEEWEGIDFQEIAKAARNGDKSAKEYIFWQMKDIIETKFSKDRKRVSIWANRLNISEKNSDYSANNVVDNWVSASWMAVFDGYPITDTNTIGPFIKYVQPGRGLDYLTWVYYTKVGAILYMSNNLEATGGMSTELTRNLGNVKQDLTTSSGNEKVGKGDHSINREVQDDLTSDLSSPEEEFELQDNLKTFRAFTKDPELNEKKNGFSPMIAFKTIIMNMVDSENAERNMANLAVKYNVSRNTFASYAQKAANDLVNVYDITLEDLQNLLKRYGPEALGRMIQESSYIPKPFDKLNESYDFRLLESLFTNKETLKESEYPDRIAECPCCGHIFKETDYADYTCPECGEFFDIDDLNFRFEDDEFQDGAPDTHMDDILDDLSENTQRKQSLDEWTEYPGESLYSKYNRLALYSRKVLALAKEIKAAGGEEYAAQLEEIARDMR